MRTILDGEQVVSHFSKGEECCSYCQGHNIRKGKYVGLIFHDLRRSAVRNLVQAGVDRTTAKNITGHKDDSIFERYDIRVTSDLQSAAQKMAASIAARREAAAKKQARKLRAV
jgi:integrase